MREVRRKTRRIFTSEQKILIVMEAMRGETSAAAICRKYGIAYTVFYKWNKEFMEAGKKRLPFTTRVRYCIGSTTDDGIPSKAYGST